MAGDSDSDEVRDPAGSAEDAVARAGGAEETAGEDGVVRDADADAGSEERDADASGTGDADDSGAGDEAESPRWWTHRLPTRSGALIGVLLALLGFALAVQLRGNDSDQGLSGLRQEDLVRILDDLDSRKERLQRESASLNAQKQQISSGAQGRQAAVDDARRRADELGILAGTLPAQGPGLSIRFVPGADPIAASVVLDAVEELRGAGAEAMQIAGAGARPVRVVASTSFVDSGSRLAVGSARLAGPYTVLVIGDPSTMQAALNIPGGVVDTVRQAGGSVSVAQPDVVHVSATRSAPSARYARPVS